MLIVDNMVELLKKYDFVIKIILFGSRTNNEARKDSDYDICIIIKNDTEKELLFNELGNYMIVHKVIIHPYIFTEKEYIFKKRIGIFKKNIFENGKVLFSKG